MKLKLELPLSVHLESAINSFDTFLTLGHYQQRTNKNSVVYINKIPTPTLNSYRPFAPEGVAISFYRILPNRIEIHIPKEEGLGVFIKVIGGDFFTQRRGLILQFFMGVILLSFATINAIHHSRMNKNHT